jgi:hypothetical protein
VGKEFGTPHRKRPRRKIKTDIGLDECDKCAIRRAVDELHTTENECPALKSFLSVLTSVTESGLFGE